MNARLSIIKDKPPTCGHSARHLWIGLHNCSLFKWTLIPNLPIANLDPPSSTWNLLLRSLCYFGVHRMKPHLNSKSFLMNRNCQLMWKPASIGNCARERDIWTLECRQLSDIAHWNILVPNFLTNSQMLQWPSSAFWNQQSMTLAWYIGSLRQLCKILTVKTQSGSHENHKIYCVWPYYEPLRGWAVLCC